MQRLYQLSAVLFLVLTPSLNASAKEQTAETFAHGGKAQIVEVIDGDTVGLDDGRQVRLVGIQAPKLLLSRRHSKPWPMAAQAKQALEEMALRRAVHLRYGGESIDRHGRVLAHLFLDDGVWLQGEMLKKGLARVYTFPDNRSNAAAMYALETTARRQGLGIWSDPFYAVLTPSTAGGRVGEFQLVEGAVLNAAKAKGSVYLNFGADWRKDFTIMIRAKALRAFLKANADPLSLKGKYIRVRGWLKYYNGPLVEATHPEQIEIISSRN